MEGGSVFRFINNLGIITCFIKLINKPMGGEGLRFFSDFSTVPGGLMWKSSNTLGDSFLGKVLEECTDTNVTLR